jgi:hypothetical protein
MFGGLVWVVLMWFLQAVIDTPNAAQQSGQEGGSRMVKVISKTVVNFAANASTALYINSLPALTIRAPRSMLWMLNQ